MAMRPRARKRLPGPVVWLLTLTGALFLAASLATCSRDEPVTEVDLSRREEIVIQTPTKALTYAYLPQYSHTVSYERHKLLVEYLQHYSPEQARRHEVRPGVTGLAQALGRNALTWEEKFRLDVQYVDQRDLTLDLRILAATVRTVIKREGIAQPGHVTMRRFGEVPDGD